MPAGWILADLMTRKIKLGCIKSVILGLGTFSVADPDPFDMDPDAAPAFQFDRIRIQLFYSDPDPCRF
jgi:hypothetical protein